MDKNRDKIDLSMIYTIFPTNNVTPERMSYYSA